MEIFSESPKSFKVDRKSPFAAKLKSSISKKLLQFLGDYTDDVLAEYIIVLVCNGKHQIQAKEDLEAFLGGRSGEFVSWLWCHLLKCACVCKDVVATSPSSSSADRDLRSNRSEGVDTHSNASADCSLTNNGNYFHTTNRVSPKNMELFEGAQCSKGLVDPSNLLETKKEQSQKHRSVIQSEVGTAEKIGGDTLRDEPSVISTGRVQSYERMDNSKLIVNHKGNGLGCQVFSFPRREVASKISEPSTTEGPHGRETYATNVSARNPISTVAEFSCENKKLRGSVWDRLGKPCEEKFVVNEKSLDAHAGDIVEKHHEAKDQLKLPLPVDNGNFFRNAKCGVHILDKSFESNNCNERNQEQRASTSCKPLAENNIRQKRNFSNISSGPSFFSVPSVDQNTVDNHFKERSQDSKKLNSTSEIVSPVLFSQVKDVRQKLLQIEMEMSKLRTKQLEMRKEGQPLVLSSSGVIKLSEEDVDSRTVFATNVHFAATREALSLHFAKCGVVSNVLILTDKLNGQWKGSAYITFVSKDSVDKAVALSGTSFFSRTLKVVRKGDEATATTKPPLCAAKPTQPQPSLVDGKTSFEKPRHPPRTHHLQWQREPLSAPSGQSASTAEETGGITTSLASKHRVSGTTFLSLGTPATA